jgi:hypothetical protein
MKNFEFITGDKVEQYLENRDSNRKIIYEKFKELLNDNVFPSYVKEPTYKGTANIWDDIYDVSFYINPDFHNIFIVLIRVKDKWIFLEQKFNENCDMDYTDTKVDIDTFGKCLTSLVLNFEEYPENFIIRSLCGQIADKIGCMGYFRVLD